MTHPEYPILRKSFLQWMFIKSIVEIQAAEILNNQIESIPDKSNALILASLDLAFKSQMPQESEDTNALSKKAEESLKALITEIEKSLS